MLPVQPLERGWITSTSPQNVNLALTTWISKTWHLDSSNACLFYIACLPDSRLSSESRKASNYPRNTLHVAIQKQKHHLPAGHFTRWYVVMKQQVALISSMYLFWSLNRFHNNNSIMHVKYIVQLILQILFSHNHEDCRLPLCWGLGSQFRSHMSEMLIWVSFSLVKQFAAVLEGRGFKHCLEVGREWRPCQRVRKLFFKLEKGFSLEGI